MNIIYILSLVYLLVMFLIYKKKDNKLCIISSLVYAIALLFCYNTFTLYLLYLLGINGSILIFSIINYFIGSIMLLVQFLKKDKIQNYYLDKKKLVLVLVLCGIVLLVGTFRFRGFSAISFESGDSSIHYRHALEFKEELSILDESNSQDDVYGYFERVMPISYVNAGLLFNIFSGCRDYIVFLVYNVICLLISALVFLVTIIDCFKYKKRDYVFACFLALVYILAYPLNSFLFGFCYLTLGIMVVNLLYLTIWHFKDDFDKSIIFKLIVITLITFSVFYSYYLFVPAIYLALGIYYIYLWRCKKISFSKMFLYGFITLIIPFALGFSYFFITLFADRGANIVSTMINLPGYSYDNVTPICLFVVVTGCLVYDLFKKNKVNYLKFNLYSMSIYIMIFLILYWFKRADLYYFYKLFYIYWFFVILFLGKGISKFRYGFYAGLFILAVINVFVFVCPRGMAKDVAVKSNIFSYNTALFDSNLIVFDNLELEIVEESKKYYDVCGTLDHFLMVSRNAKRMWYYAITDKLPFVWTPSGEVWIFYSYSLPNFKTYEYVSSEYPCVIYYYEDGDIDIDSDRYDVLYKNEAGLIIRRIK